MSLEMHVFLRDDSLPSVGEWQAAITRLSLQLQLDLTLEPESMLGFVPCRINDAESGVEMFVDSVSEVVATYPAIASIVHDARSVVTFRWGGDLMECACALGAAAGLVEFRGAVVYYPPDDIWYNRDGLLSEFNAIVNG